jgi:hypothetical protein
MSWNTALGPHCPTGAEIDVLEMLIIPRARG